MESKFKEELIFAVFFILYVGLIFVFNTLSLFAGGGFEEVINQVKTFLYLAPLVLIAVFNFVLVYLKKELPNAKWAKAIRTYSFDPEYGIFTKWKFSRPIARNLILFLLFWILILGAFAGIGQTQQTALFPTASVPTYGVEQQITPTADLWTSVEPASSSETGMLWFVVIFIFSLTAIILRNQPKLIKMILPFITSSIAGASFWVAQHLFRYGASEFMTISNFSFGLFSIGLLFISGSVIPPIIYHQLNNFFIKGIELFSNELFLFGVISVWIVLAVIFVWLYRREFKKGNIETLNMGVK